MTEDVHTARRRRAAVTARPALRRPMRPVAAGAWLAAIAGFVVYLAAVDSLVEAYGGIGIGIVLLLWVTLFSVLYHATPILPVPMLTGRAAGAAGPRPATTEEHPSPLVGRVERVVVPSAALRNPVAQGRMMSVLGPRAGEISERETDMMDWGFAFGVAWAIVHGQDPDAPEEVLSERALSATQAVYRAYRGSLAPPLAEAAPPPHGPPGRAPADSATHAHADGSRAPDAPDLCA